MIGYERGIHWKPCSQARIRRGSTLCETRCMRNISTMWAREYFIKPLPVNGLFANDRILFTFYTASQCFCNLGCTSYLHLCAKSSWDWQGTNVWKEWHNKSGERSEDADREGWESAALDFSCAARTADGGLNLYLCVPAVLEQACSLGWSRSFLLLLGWLYLPI